MKNYISFQVLILLASTFLKAYDSEAITNVLHSHSFKSPFIVQNFNNGWHFEYATINTSKYLVLIPNICNRRGLLYHDKPILSDNITIEFNFHINKKHPKQPLDDKYYSNKNNQSDEYKINVEEREKKNGFGFWILENILIDKTESNELVEDFSLFGYKKNFNGIGFFFELKQDKLIVSSLVNNGNSDINANDAIVKIFDVGSIIMNDLIIAKITSYNGEINISLYEPQTLNYVQIISIKKKMPAKNYIGFTAFNFQESENKESVDTNIYEPTFVGIKEVRIYNFHISDENKTKDNQIYMNDDNKNDLSIDNLNKSINNILKEFSPRNSQIQQTEALIKLTNLFQSFMSERIKYEQKLLNYMNTMSSMLQNTEAELIYIKKYINKSDDPKNLKNVFTTELTGLKNLFNTHTQHHKKSIEDITNRLTKKIDNNQDLKIIAEKTQKLEHIINKGNSTTYIFAVGFTGIIVITLFLVYKKIRDVEKKHIL